VTFTGFPVAALDFYDDLEVDNTKSFWEAHKGVYAEAVKAPMEALAGALADEFGTAKIFRPYRDVRFAKDKTPYKTHQGAYVAAAPATGWYVEISARGVRTGAGFYDATSHALARLRSSIADDRTGPQLKRLVSEAMSAGYTIGGETLKTTPRGFPADHPRIDLLRHKSLSLGRVIGFEPVVHTPDLLDLVRDDWRRLRPFVEWVASHRGDE